MRSVFSVLTISFLLAAFTPSTSYSQVGSLKKKVEEAKKKAEEALRKASADSAKNSAIKDSVVKADSAKAKAGQGAAPTAAKADPKVWENYDFVPGSKVMFFTDFSEDKVGNFARRLKYVKGSVEIVERDGAKVLRATGPSQFLIPLGKRLPEKFTLEIDVIAKAGGIMTRSLQFEGGLVSNGGAQSASVTWNPRTAWIEGSERNMATSTSAIPDGLQSVISGNVAHLRLRASSRSSSWALMRSAASVRSCPRGAACSSWPTQRLGPAGSSTSRAFRRSSTSTRPARPTTTKSSIRTWPRSGKGHDALRRRGRGGAPLPSLDPLGPG